VGRGLIVLGAVQAVLGLRHLGRQLTAFPEPVTRGRLVDRGIYGLVRHPLYGANVILTAGLALHQNSSWAIVVAVMSVGFYMFKAISEEGRLIFRYPEYRAYQEVVTARLIPFLF
jgi:protein-S-isoprenylcysteine O-methyltransferase Ste14